jgi:hypothetical protein
MANDVIMKFGSTTTVITEAVAIPDGNFSANTVQLDNSTLLYPYARAVFNNPDAFAAAPDDKSTVDLYMVQDDVDGGDSETSAPSGTDAEAALYVGSFLIYNADVEQRQAINISLQGVQKARFFIQNKTGQALSYSSNAITVKITPFTYTPSV